MENKPKSPNNYLAFSKTGSTSPRGSVLQNLTNTFQRSVISTSKSKNDNRNESTNKSKIKSLPNYQRYSMGNNLPFVTIFQTIEIERLSDQIETQRIKLKQYERHIFNAANFQVQIKELSERCAANENQLNEYRDQLDKMNKICETLYHENENLKNKLKNTDSTFKFKLEEENKKNKQLNEEIQRWVKRSEMSEQMRQNEIEQMRSMMEKQRKSMIDREMKDLEVRHQSETAKLITQIRRLNQLLTVKEAELTDVKKKHQNSQDYIKELKQYGSKLNEYQEKICMLSQEHLRLSRIIDVNTSELDLARKKQFKLAQQLKTDKQLLIDNEHLRELIEMKHNEMQMWRKQYAEMEEELFKSRDLQQINQELSAKLACLNQQNQKLSRVLKERSVEIERWRSNINQLEQNSNRCREYEDMVIQQQSKYKVLQVENQRLEGVNKIRVREIEELKNKLMVVQSGNTNLVRIEKEKKNIEEKYKTQLQRIMELQMYIQRSQEELKTLRQSTNKLQSSQSVIESLRKQNERLLLKIEEYSKQLRNLKQFEAQLGQQHTKLRENSAIVSQYEDQNRIMTDQIGRLSEMLKNKNEQIVRLQDERISNYTMLSQYKNLQNAVQDKDRTISKLKADLDACQSRLNSYQQKMEEIDNKNQQLFANLTQQMQALELEARKKSKQCEQLKSRQTKLMNEIEELGQVQKLNQKQQNRITIYVRDLQELRNQIKEYERVLSQQRRSTSQLQSQLRKLKSTVNEHELTTIRSVSESRNGQSGVSSSVSGSGWGWNSSIDAGKLMERITQLELILRDLKIKYGELLKQVADGSSRSIKSSQNSMIDIA